MRCDESKKQTNTRGKTRAKVLNIIGIILCILLLPIVVANMTMAVKAVINPDVPPSFLGYTPMIVSSGSMEPMFDTNDLVVVKSVSDPDELAKDTVICYLTGETLVTHRIIGTELAEDKTVAYVTQGDANNAPDSTRVAPEQIIGTYVTHFDNLGGFALFMQTPTGMLLCVVLPLIVLFCVFYGIDHHNYKVAMAGQNTGAIASGGGDVVAADSASEDLVDSDDGRGVQT